MLTLFVITVIVEVVAVSILIRRAVDVMESIRRTNEYIAMRQ